MTQKISRRDFLKLAGVGAATTAVLTGCGPAAKFVTRQPYLKMPEYTYNGESTYYATTCRECAAACGLVVRTMQGRAIKVEGNKANPVNLGKTCARGQTTLQGLYNPDRVTAPTKQGRAKDLSGSAMNWDDAVATVSDILKKYKASEIAFLMGTAPDHLFDLATDLTGAMGASAPVRYGALSMFEGRATLAQAAQEMFGQPALPFFDLASADVVVSFGANFLETWVSPVAYTRGYSKLRKGHDRRRGLFFQFEARMSQTGSVADEWIALRPGTEGLVALALGKLVAEARGGSMPKAFASVNVNEAAEKAGVELEALHVIAEEFAKANAPLAIVGGPALAHSNGVETTKAVYALNAAFSSSFFLSPLAPGEDVYHRPASAQEMSEFVKKLESGAVKALFIHGVNPAFELPKSLGFEAALKNVETVISFATFPDETALLSDYIFPDHHALESFGYQRAYTGANASVLSGLQPAVTPFVDTKATADVLLAAAAQAGFPFPYADEFAFIQGKLQQFVPIAGGSFAAPEINAFTAFFQQFGGWWKQADLVAPTASNGAVNAPEAEFEEGEFFLIPFVSPTLGEAGANKPWLQETADPTTTVMWNTWVEINPETAHELGVENDDVVKIVSAAGEVEASVYLYPAIRPDVIAIPFGQGHTAYGQFAAGRGVNPADLFGAKFNAAGDLAYAGVKVRVEKTGKKQYLSRLESKIGVYGEGLGEEH
ncbi:MAG: molybdopterin-dependent oxidoreductase [Chloroflexi bacterium]|nr:molybdopterin-dependent oxidoreductase [Chloroflexota bacterium]